METGGEMTVEVREEADTETVLLRHWLETLAPVTRYVYDKENQKNYIFLA